MRAFIDFSSFEQEFLLPLSKKWSIKIQEKPLADMQGWQTTEEGHLKNSFFEVIGTHTDVLFDVSNEAAGSMHWDQPIYRQPNSDLALFLDDEDFILIRGLFEPGNATRGYQQTGLTLCTSCKMSAGNMARLKAMGKIPPFSDLMEHTETKELVRAKAPGDGARANKENTHHLYRAPRTAIEESYNKIDPTTREAYVLVTRDVFKQAYLNGLMTEHLRDLTSLMLFI